MLCLYSCCILYSWDAQNSLSFIHIKSKIITKPLKLEESRRTVDSFNLERTHYITTVPLLQGAWLTLYWSCTSSTTLLESLESVPDVLPSMCFCSRSYTPICSDVTANITLIAFCFTFRFICKYTSHYLHAVTCCIYTTVLWWGIVITDEPLDFVVVIMIQSFQ